MCDPAQQEPATVPVVMTIAGSDSGGGAGIQADLKTFAALGAFGTSAITCITAQNPDQVRGVAAIDADMVALQIRTVCDGFPVAAAKTGMLYSVPIIQAVARTVAACGIDTLVVDPVMVATSGARLLREDAVAALCSDLVPLATLLTPNVPEAEILCGHDIRSVDQLRRAAREIGETFGVACVVKGGHLSGAEIVDALYHEGVLQVFTIPRVDVSESHGTGCTFSAAVAAWLAKGAPLPEAVKQAQRFVASAMQNALAVGGHRPLGLA